MKLTHFAPKARTNFHNCFSRFKVNLTDYPSGAVAQYFIPANDLAAGKLKGTRVNSPSRDRIVSLTNDTRPSRPLYFICQAQVDFGVILPVNRSSSRAVTCKMDAQRSKYVRSSASRCTA